MKYADYLKKLLAAHQPIVHKDKSFFEKPSTNATKAPILVQANFNWQDEFDNAFLMEAAQKAVAVSQALEELHGFLWEKMHERQNLIEQNNGVKLPFKACTISPTSGIKLKLNEAKHFALDDTSYETVKQLITGAVSEWTKYTEDRDRPFAQAVLDLLENKAARNQTFYLERIIASLNNIPIPENASLQSKVKLEQAKQILASERKKVLGRMFFYLSLRAEDGGYEAIKLSLSDFGLKAEDIEKFMTQNLKDSEQEDSNPQQEG